ncbi:MAG: hypothetical protein L0Y71_03045 [Gemmataceae bacterium]|nr:hypothetical protein [Gemmataceae bacterium]
MLRKAVAGCICLVLAAWLGGLSPAPAQPPANLKELSQALKPLLADALPTVLYEKHDNWGRKTMVAHAIHWRGLRPEIKKTPRNDGTWKWIKISVRNPKQTVDIRMYGLKRVNDEKQTFKTDLAFLCGVEYDQQVWERGIRLWSAGIRARLRVKAHLDCENTIRVETKENAFLPDIVFRLRVTKAKVSYDDLVVEHIAGIGGTAAKVIGETFHDAMNQWRPSIERKLLERASAAIVKAADTKEVRIGLSSLFKESK